MDTLRFDAAEDLYCTDVEDWINLNKKRYGSQQPQSQGHQSSGWHVSARMF